jgi:hypothetical protein
MVTKLKSGIVYPVVEVVILLKGPGRWVVKLLEILPPFNFSKNSLIMLNCSQLKRNQSTNFIT